MTAVKENNIIDPVLELHRAALGRYYDAYRNHIYRVYNLSLAKLKENGDENLLSVAAVFHDLGIWTSKTFDYIPPSVKLAEEYCSTQNKTEEFTREVVLVIEMHHKLTAINQSLTAEIFRRADLADLTLGLIIKDNDRIFLRHLRKEFPNRGFHLFLTVLFFRNLITHPLSPLPMYRW